MRIKFGKPSIPVLMFTSGLVGMLLSLFLWYSHLNAAKVIGCLTGGCEVVLSSPYAKTFGVPIAAYGFAYYAVLSLVSYFRMVDDRVGIVRISSWVLASTGILASIYFFYLELYKIHAICSWCKVSTVLTVFLLVLAVQEIRKFGGWKNFLREIKELAN
ncbi:vitamin K epoxide reductase family protein [bacterium]|nr:vitamin K epoxide reductase family protein [bacterium]